MNPLPLIIKIYDSAYIESNLSSYGGRSIMKHDYLLNPKLGELESLYVSPQIFILSFFELFLKLILIPFYKIEINIR